MVGEEIRIPRIALELIESRIDDSTTTRRDRGIRQFSLLADNSSGTTTLGVSANDRVTRFNRMMSSDRPPSRATSHRSGLSNTGWPVLLAIAVTVTAIGLAIAGSLSCHYNKTCDLSWTFCSQSPDKNNDEDPGLVHVA